MECSFYPPEGYSLVSSCVGATLPLGRACQCSVSASSELVALMQGECGGSWKEEQSLTGLCPCGILKVKASFLAIQ